MKSYQCDQMVQIIFQYWTIYINVNSPKSTKNYQRWYKILPNTNLSQVLEIAQRFAEYCQIGEISPNLVTLNHTYLDNCYYDCQLMAHKKLKWTTASFDFHQMAVHKSTTMLAHCNLKQNMWLCSKQSSFFSFYALPSGGKSKDVVVHCAKKKFRSKIKKSFSVSIQV